MASYLLEVEKTSGLRLYKMPQRNAGIVHDPIPKGFRHFSNCSPTISQTLWHVWALTIFEYMRLCSNAQVGVDVNLMTAILTGRFTLLNSSLMAFSSFLRSSELTMIAFTIDDDGSLRIKLRDDEDPFCSNEKLSTAYRYGELFLKS